MTSMKYLWTPLKIKISKSNLYLVVRSSTTAKQSLELLLLSIKNFALNHTSTYAVFVFLIIVSANCDNKTSPKNTQNSIPKASIEAKAIENGVQINIQVPPNHHAYLDRGPEDLLIPVSFDWADLIKKKILSIIPKKKSAPAGVSDKTGAKVLRGTGSFQFDLPDSQKLEGKKIKVTTQLCDDIQGVCYRPDSSEITIQ